MSSEDLTLSIRLIRSCEHRNIRFLPLHQVDKQWTSDQLMEVIKEKVKNSSSLPPPFKKFDFNCLKIEHQAHGAKTNDPVINTENDQELMLKAGNTLELSDVRNETEIAFFNLTDYRNYQASKKLLENQ